ncbi:hypothetical protein NHG29_01725 [Aerococcaceae bacterium NML160702]|nr:hypothetical protein [Aerococcaceae bacterium NML160702]
MRITMSLTSDYVIDSDGTQYTLRKLNEVSSEDGSPKLDEDGKQVITERTIGYYTRLDQCLRVLARLLVDDKNSEIELKEYIKQLQDIYGMIQAEMIF